MRVDLDPAILGLLEISRLPSNLRQRLSPPRPSTAQAFFAQLEGEWTGPSELSAHRTRAFNQLVGPVAGRSAQESRMAFMFDDRKLSSAAAEVLADCALFHAYTATVAIAFIARAKEANGILPSSEFHWLRKDDPALWLMVNGFGRPRHDARIAGAFAHYEHERSEGRSTATHFDDCAVVQ
jgi:hypothetical protein